MPQHARWPLIIKPSLGVCKVSADSLKHALRYVTTNHFGVSAGPENDVGCARNHRPTKSVVSFSMRLGSEANRFVKAFTFTIVSGLSLA